MRAFAREPALWLGLLSTVVQLVSTFIFALTPEQQALINAAAVAVSAVATSYVLAQDRQVPVLVGALQAVLALGVGFGLELPPEQQSTITAAVAALAAMFIRTQVWAPEPPVVQGRHARRD